MELRASKTMTAVIPTALRRLGSNWRVGPEPAADFVIGNNPLPEFIPSTLFSDLNLPEVQIILPPAWEGDEPEPQPMGIAQGLRTFAPGRVSRRFGAIHALRDDGLVPTHWKRSVCFPGARL